MNGNGAISDNDEAANNPYIFFFTSVPYTLREDVESDGIQVASGYLGCNAIYTSPWRHNSHFYVKPQKKSVTVSMRTVAIPNLDVKV